MVGRPHLGGDIGLGYRAGGGGSEHWRTGDYLYTKPRWSLMRGRNDAPFSTPSQGETIINYQAQSYGLYLSKIQYKGTNHLLDFSSGDRSSWVKRLDEFTPWSFTPSPYGQQKMWANNIKILIITLTQHLTLKSLVL